MKIEKYEDLTQFIYNEFDKMTATYGKIKPSNEFIKFNEQTLMKYTKLYDKPLMRKQKREIALMEALDTMPHGWVWKLFHWDLWQKIKLITANVETETTKEENVTKSESTSVEVYTPTVIKKTTLPDVQEPRE